MIRVSQHAIKRFIQRYDNRPTLRSTENERTEARETLRVWYDLSLPLSRDKRIYGNFILVVENNTIITVLKKSFERK
jgi:hypothetical protein